MSFARDRSDMIKQFTPRPLQMRGMAAGKSAPFTVRPKAKSRTVTSSVSLDAPSLAASLRLPLFGPDGTDI